MSPLLTPIMAGITAMIITVALSILTLKRVRSHSGTQISWRNSLPILCGLGVGILILALLVETYVLGDRYYGPGEALAILAATAAGCFLIWLVEIVLPRPRWKLWARAAGHLLTQIIAAGLLVCVGVRFELMKVPGEGVTFLNTWQSSLWTIAWLITATNLIRLLDGLHGAAGVAVIIAGITALFSNMVYNEFFLSGVALVAIGCAGGSLWFCTSRRRLPLEGSGTAIFGFLFATLTVLARQKTVATLLLLIPLVLIILVAGAAMMGLLEKRLLLPKDEEK